MEPTDKIPGIADKSAWVTFFIEGTTERRRMALKILRVLKTDRDPVAGARAIPIIIKSKIFQPSLKKDNFRYPSFIYISITKIDSIQLSKKLIC